MASVRVYGSYVKTFPVEVVSFETLFGKKVSTGEFLKNQILSVSGPIVFSFPASFPPASLLSLR